VLPMLYAETPKHLLFYAFSLIGLFLYYGGTYYVITQRNGVFLDPARRLAAKGRNAVWIYFGLLFAVNAAILLASHRVSAWPFAIKLLLLQAAWVVIVLLPIYPALWIPRDEWNERAASAAVTRACVVVLIGISIQLFAVFLPYLQGRIEMMNEYMDIPEQTRLGGGYVDNTAFINEHRIGGLLKYDPRTDKGASPRPRPGTYIRLPKTDLLMQFVAGHRSAYYYDPALRALVVNRAMLPKEHVELGRIVETAGERDLVDRLAYTSAQEETVVQRQIYTPEEVEFLQKNQLELRWQILSRWVIHHHNFVLGPINEYALGKPLKEINLQYGFFNVVFMKHLLEWTGGINYRNYFRVWYSFWPLYYALFLGLAFFLFREIRYVLLTALLAFGSILAINYQILFLGPGLNPIRHFLDILVAAALVFYLRRDSALAFFASLGLALVSIVNNQQFGLFLTAALLATLVLRFLQERRARFHEIIGIVVTALAAAGVFVWGSLGKDDMARYYLEGFVSFYLNPIRLWGITMGFGVLLTMLVRYHDARSDLKYAAWFLVLYAQALMAYYVWGATDNHFLNIAPVLVLAVVATLKFWIDQSGAQAYKHLIGVGMASAAFLFLYAPGMAIYYRAEHQYRQVFRDHRTFDWDMDRARFKSTMDPAFFMDSTRLIRKYSQGRNAVHIISKYDNFLPFLAGKFSAMPFFDVPWFLVTEKEVERCVSSLRQAGPEYLFVDTDIERSLNGEVLNPKEFAMWTLHDESLQRVQRLEKLRKVFEAVKGDYKPVERGVLLTVYGKARGLK
jgi:hypothetical protein